MIQKTLTLPKDLITLPVPVMVGFFSDFFFFYIEIFTSEVCWSPSLVGLSLRIVLSIILVQFSRLLPFFWITVAATCGTGTAYTFGTPAFTTIFKWSMLNILVCSFWLLFVFVLLLFFNHVIVFQYLLSIICLTSYCLLSFCAFLYDFYCCFISKSRVTHSSTFYLRYLFGLLLL